MRDEATHQFAGAYEWINPDAEIAPLDQWVIDLFAAHADIERSTNQADILVEWDKPDNVAWAVHYLRNNSPTAIEGQGGELTTLKIAATLKDHGDQRGHGTRTDAGALERALSRPAATALGIRGVESQGPQRFFICDRERARR